MRGSRNFCQRGSNIDKIVLYFCFLFVLFFLVGEEREDP